MKENIYERFRLCFRLRPREKGSILFLIFVLILFFVYQKVYQPFCLFGAMWFVSMQLNYFRCLIVHNLYLLVLLLFGFLFVCVVVIDSKPQTISTVRRHNRQYAHSNGAVHFSGASYFRLSFALSLSLITIVFITSFIE